MLLGYSSVDTDRSYITDSNIISNLYTRERTTTSNRTCNLHQEH